MRRRVHSILLLGAAGLMLNVGSAQAGSVTYNFDNDPAGTLEVKGSNPEIQRWQAKGGNPATGGFIAVTVAQDNFNSHIVFPDIDSGKIVTAFKFECDLRIGNSDGARAADGFSINFARANDPMLAEWETDPGRGYAGDTRAGGNEDAPMPETGTKTGIAISFDTWSGNVLPDGADIEGIIVRVDNKTVTRKALATRHGACEDATSLQTGPRDPDFWVNIADPLAPEAYQTLCWQPFSAELDESGKLTVKWKNTVILDQFQTAYFPSPGRLVFGGRTGGENQATHIDNLKLTTTAITPDTENPSAPAGLTATQTGAQRVALSWTVATDNSGRVAYEIEQNGTVLQTPYTNPSVDLRGLSPTTDYTFRVRATDVSGNKSAWTSELKLKTAAMVDDKVFAYVKIYGTTASNIGGTAVQGLLDDPRYPNSPDRLEVISGMTFGETTSFGNTFGDNIGFRIAGTVTPPETGNYYFFIRSDDASQLFVNTTGPTIPVAGVDFPIAEESGCCNAFLEPGASQTTAEAIRLVAGQKYGILFLVKEGGGGDWGQVAWRKEGDTTAAGSLQPIAYPYFESEPVKVDAVGAVAKVLQNPLNVTTPANEKVTFLCVAETASPYNSPVLYRWFKNGVAMPGNNSPAYTIPVVTAADNGAKFKCMVAVQGASATSTEATLTVNADTKAPSIVSVKGSPDMSKATLVFSESVAAASATAVANYALSEGVTVIAAQQLNPTTVTLTTLKQAEGATYTVTVNNVQDQAGNAMANATAKFRSYAFTPGKVVYEVYTGISGTVVTDLTGNAKYPNNPDIVQTLNAFSSPVDWADNFGARLSGYITPKTAGNYVFFVNADDGAELFLSTDENPANMKLIAQETGWSPTLTWLGIGGGSTVEDKRSDQFAGTKWGGNTINLQADKRYYAELLYKEGGGGDEGQATMKLASEPDPANGTPSKLTGDLVGAFVGPVAPFRDYGIGLNFGADALSNVDCNLDATQMTGVPDVIQANWNNLNGQTGTAVANIVADNAGNSETTAVTVDWTCNNLWTSTGQGEENSQFSGADRALMTGYLDTTDNSTTSVKIANIPDKLTSTGYDVYVYFMGGVADGKGGGYRIVNTDTKAVLKDYVHAISVQNPSTYIRVPEGTTHAKPGAGNYIVFSGLTAKNITVEAATAGGLGIAPASAARAPINAIQLIAPASAVAPPVVEGPALKVERAANGITITFEGSLQSADAVTGPWADVTGASPQTITPTGNGKFYRAKR